MNAAKRPQTIQIFLPTGDPNGIRQAEITTRSVRVLDSPSSALTSFAQDEAVAGYLNSTVN